MRILWDNFAREFGIIGFFMEKIKYCLHFFLFFCIFFRGPSDVVCVEKIFARTQMAGFREKTQKVLPVSLVTIEGTVMKTTLIHNGATPQGIEIIRNLLAENDIATNSIKNRVICVDLPDKVYLLQDFLSQDEFTFCPMDPSCPVDINESIDKVIILTEKGLKK